MPAISILIPTFDPQPDHLKAAIHSVLAQTFSDWELIIHDDASRTDTEQIVRPFLTDPRILFRKSPRRLGIGGNWNASIGQATAPLVAFLFQDDLWNPNYLKRSVEILQKNPDVGFTAANHSYRIDTKTAASVTGIYKEVEDLRAAEMPEGRIVGEKFLKKWIERGLRPNLIGEPSFVVLRRTLIESAGPFRDDMQQGLDAEYWIRCLQKSDGWWIRESLGEFRVHSSGASAINEQSGSGRADRLKMFRILIRSLPHGELRTLAKRTMRREFLRMVQKFLSRRVRRVS